MIPVHQWSKDSCFAACVASILHLGPSDVPNFCHMNDRPNWRENVDEWLAPRGLAYLDIGMAEDARADLVRFWGYHIISGDGPRGHRHSVVGLRGEIVFDPYPEGGGLKEDRDRWEYGLFVLVDPSRWEYTPKGS